VKGNTKEVEQVRKHEVFGPAFTQSKIEEMPIEIGKPPLLITGVSTTT
jgi:hypothetical protein